MGAAKSFGWYGFHDGGDDKVCPQKKEVFFHFTAACSPLASIKIWIYQFQYDHLS